MKKSLVALAILAAAGVASAQSSVTLFGVVDVNYAHGSGSGVGSSSKSQITDSGYNSSRLGFRGTEDLGGGMSASFWLEAGINPDNGTGDVTNTNNQTTGTGAATAGTQGLTFNRRSTVSLASGLGELRLGRDYTPQFWNQTVFDPFGTNGVGTTQTLSSSIGGNALTGVRASNSVGYFLPGNLGGFYGQFQAYMGENNKNGAATEKDGNGSAIRLGYANGPVNVALATASTKFAPTATTGKIRSTNLGGSFDFGVAQAMALVTRDKVDSTPTSVTGKGALIGALVPMGAGQIRASYSTYKTDAAGTPKSKKWALGYVHNLSKRTALYTTFARVTNSGGAAQALNGAVTAANARSTGYDFGIKHSF
ncbi:MAG: porin [Polaromonas sp.]|uniref:porin n=1 Tax=Polaromonas sp. TaxID=1869339 RepID=UPI0024893F66|nr:porin [Polaromonas sp.]MDI1236268.1 porin [Polaromonas sp.]